MGSKPVLTSTLPQGVSTFLEKEKRWFVGFEEMKQSDDKTVRRAVRMSFADVVALLAGEKVEVEGVGDPASSEMRSLGNGLNVVGMDCLSRLSAAATLDTVYILGYREHLGEKVSFKMSVRAFGAYVHG